MTVFWVLLGIAVLCGVAVVASGRGDGLALADPDRPDVGLPADRPAVREDVDRVRFSVGLRGYRMDEVDDVLDRLAGDLALRDAMIAYLEDQLGLRAATSAERSAAATEPAPAPVAAVEGAAMVPASGVETDAATARTLLVPLEPFMTDRHTDRAPDRAADPSAEQSVQDEAHG